MRTEVWQSLIAVGASILGWALAMLGQAFHSGRQNRREHYYRVLERTEEILARCNRLANFVYLFHKSCAKIKTSDISGQTRLADFITDFQSQTASIYLSQRLFYPGIKIDPTPMTRAAEALTKSIREMWTLIAVVSEPGIDPESALFKLDENRERREAILQDFATELGIIQNIMVTSINKRAKKLRIRAEPVTVDRSKLNPSSPTSQQEHAEKDGSAAPPWRTSPDAEPWDCPRCGKPNEGAAFTCSGCGYRLV